MSRRYNSVAQAIRLRDGTADCWLQEHGERWLSGLRGVSRNLKKPLQSNRCAPRRVLIATFFCLMIVVRGNALFGQGLNPVVMHTGSGLSLLSQSFSYTSGVGGSSPSAVTIDFGFATEEQLQPGVIPDSFTISITGPTGTGYLVTVDASGTQFAPFVPGALPITGASLQASLFLASTEGLTNQASYTIDYTLPAGWLGVPLNINFDLFDNQNALRSLGYYSVPVPEPGSAALLILSLSCWLKRRHGK